MTDSWAGTRLSSRRCSPRSRRSHRASGCSTSGAGPGALTAELVRRVGAASVAAVDPSTSFVVEARRRHPLVAVDEASAEDLPFADASFDRALGQLVVHFMADPRRGHLGELFRDAGLVEVVETRLSVEAHHDTFEQWWEPFTFGVGPAGAYVARLDDVQRARLEGACRSLLQETPIRIAASAWAARAAVSR